MAIQTVTMRNALVDAYKAQATHAALYNVNGAAASITTGQEISGGAPAYARKALAWGATAASTASATAVVFDVASGTTVAGAGVHNSATAAGSPDTSFRDGGDLTDQPFASQGTYTLTVSYTQT